MPSQIEGFNLKTKVHDEVVNDIGVSLDFLNVDDILIKDFIERKVLELIVAKDANEVQLVLDRSKSRVLLNGNDYKEFPKWNIMDGIAVLKSVKTISYTIEKGAFQLLVGDGKNNFGITFPVNIQVVTDKDKKELESELKNVLLEMNPQEIADFKMEQKLSMEIVGSSIFMNNTDFIGIAEVNNATYYTHDKTNKLVPVHNDDYLIESYVNMFHFLNDETKNVQIEIEQDMYGNVKSHFSLPLSKLHAYCKANDMKVYVGIENVNGSNIEGVVILKNEKLKFVHMLHTNCNMQQVFLGHSKGINLKLYSYIPYDNINNLFNDNNYIKRNKFKF